MSNHNKKLKHAFALNDYREYTTVESFLARVKWISKLLIYRKNKNVGWFLKPSRWIGRRWIRKHLQIISSGWRTERKQTNSNLKVISLKSPDAKYI